MTEGARSARWWSLRCFAIVAVATAARLALALGTELSPDEAYYLAAARNRVAVVDHPPLLVWLLRGADALPFGSVELRVRLVPMLLAIGTSIFAIAAARERGADARGQELVAWATSWTPLAMAGGFVATPDAPLLFGVAAALAATGPGRRRAALAFAALVFAASAKASALPILAAIAWSSRDRWTRVAAVAAAFVAAPIVAPTLAFQVRHAFAPQPVAWSWTAALLAVAAAVLVQVLFWSPWLVSRGAASLRRGPPADRTVMIALSALVLVSAIDRATPPEPNWWAPAGLVLAIAAANASWSRSARAAAIAWWLVPTLLAGAHTLRPLLPLARAADPTARLHGWRAGEDPPLDAPGLGLYGPAAEACIYRASCDEILNYFRYVDGQTSSQQ